MLTRSTDPPSYPQTYLQDSLSFSIAESPDMIDFPAWLTRVLTERHIGIDKSVHHFATVAVDTSIGRRDAKRKLTAAEICVTLEKGTKLMSWMQVHGVDETLSNVNRVIVHVEQMAFKNKSGKEFGIKLGQLLQN